LYWAGKKEHIGSFDELDMSTTRLRLRLPDEPVPEIPQPNILDISEVCVWFQSSTQTSLSLWLVKCYSLSNLDSITNIL